jgi:hypothetical protein
LVSLPRAIKNLILFSLTPLSISIKWTCLYQGSSKYKFVVLIKKTHPEKGEGQNFLVSTKNLNFCEEVFVDMMEC